MQHRLSADEHLKTITAHKGDEIVINLNESPTTGYSWEIESLDGGVCQLQSSNYELQNGAAIGGGGTRTLTFTIYNTGNGTIKLKNWQRWTGDVHKRFEVDVTAQ